MTRSRFARRRLLVVAGLLAALAVGGAASASSAPRAAERPALADHFTPEQIERSESYWGPRTILRVVSIVLGLAVLVLLTFGPTGRAFAAAGRSLSGGRWWLEAPMLAIGVTLVATLAALPLAAFRYFHDRSFGLVTQSFGGRLADIAKGTGVEMLVVAAMATGFFFLVRRLPDAWPFAAALGAAGLTVALVLVFPLVYEPLFNTFRPVEPALRSRVVEIADRAGVKVGKVLVADASKRTTRLNAYVSGLGSSRVVLYDTLIDKAPPNEVDLVVAHELAHEASKDVLKGTIVGALGAALAALGAWVLLSQGALLARLGIAGPGDPRAVPLLALALAVATLATAPIQNGISRRMEAAADRAAIEITQDPQTHIDSEVRLATENIGDLTPNPVMKWFFFTHPPVLDRIGYGIEWRRANPGAEPVEFGR